MREELIRAAIRVANRPDDHNIAVLLKAVFDLPSIEWPKEFEELPDSAFSVPGSLGLDLARYAALVEAEKIELRAR
jgi:hypothetical protein